MQAVDHGLAIEPSNMDMLDLKAMVHAARGDLDSARTVARSAAALNGGLNTAVSFAISWDLAWVLEPAHRQLLLRAQPRDVYDDRALWAIALTQTFALEGDTATARVYADTARLELGRQLREAPEDPERAAFQGLALAMLGRRNEAISAGERGVNLAGKDAFISPYVRHQLARIDVLCGEHGKAMDQLEQLLRVPYYVTRAWLRIDPNFGPLRTHPRFQKLVAGS
jgi:adenylate cyclase